MKLEQLLQALNPTIAGQPDVQPDVQQQMVELVRGVLGEILVNKQNDALTGVTLRLLEGRLNGTEDSDERRAIIREAVSDARYLLRQVSAE